MDVSLPPIDATASVSVASDGAFATLTLSPPRNGGAHATRDLIEAALADANVVHGVRGDVLEKLSRSPRYGKGDTIAQATPPTTGDDATFSYTFPRVRRVAPQVNKDGSVNFKQLGLVANVYENDVLCIKTPFTLGTPGLNVRGLPITATPGKDKPLPLGDNTVASEDGLQVLAATDGIVCFVKNLVKVLQTHEIRGDVDYSTGNIDVNAHVTIHGNVLVGFSVRAQGNVTVHGTVSGSIDAAGDVFISEGFSGQRKSTLVAGGSLCAKYVQNGTVMTETNIDAGFIISSTVQAGGQVTVSGNKAAILSSHVMARYHIECSQVGAPQMSTETTLEVGADPYLMSRYRQIPKELADLHRQLEGIDRLVTMFVQMQQRGKLPTDKEAELKKLQALQQTLNRRQVNTQMERQEVDQRIMTFGYGTINARGKIHAGTHIIIGAEAKVLALDYDNTFFSRTTDGLHMEPAHPLPTV